MFAISNENTLLCGLTLLVGCLSALALGAARSKKACVSGAKIALVTPLLALMTALLSHLFYCFVELEFVLSEYSAAYLLAFWRRGYMIFGGIIGAVLCLAVFGGKDRRVMLEQYAPSGALMLAAARIAEGFLGQGYGEYWYGDAESFLCRFPFMIYDEGYEAWGWALFVLEALVALVIFVCLLCRKRTWNGDGTLLLLGAYSCAQVVIESLRRDEFLRWGFVRVEQTACAVLVLAVLICYAVRAGAGKTAKKTLCFSAYALMIGLCILLEFATEGRISFLMFLDADGCYAVMACACAVLFACVLFMRGIGAGNKKRGKCGVVLEK